MGAAFCSGSSKQPAALAYAEPLVAITPTPGPYEKAATEVEISDGSRAVCVTPEGRDDGALERLTAGYKRGRSGDLRGRS